jgi:hypothetical protein
VERNEADLAYIAELHDALAAEAVTAIDFDRLRLWLQELAGALPELFRAREESRLLRDDFTDRISGMLKAIAVAEPGQKPISEASEIIDHLATSGAADLIDCYRRISARFRDTFPTSFGLIAARRAVSQPGGGKYKRV